MWSQRSCDDWEGRNSVETPVEWDIFIEGEGDVVARMLDWLGM